VCAASVQVSGEHWDELYDSSFLDGGTLYKSAFCSECGSVWDVGCKARRAERTRLAAGSPNKTNASPEDASGAGR
jgi:hypothetical protein